MSADRSQWPVMVRLGLWKVPTRNAVWSYFWLSVVLAVSLTALGLIYRAALMGSLMALAAFWYYLAIRWVDQHGGW